MFDYKKIINDFNLDIQTSSAMLDAIKMWSDIFNGHESWIDDTTASLHVAKTMCEKASKSVTVEYKSVCDEPYLNTVYQQFLKNKRKNTEYMLGKGSIYFKPYYDSGKIKISVIQADKMIPVKFDDDGNLLGVIIVDQVTKGTTVYTRLEYDELIENTMFIKNIAYKGKTDGVVLANKIDVTSVDKWKDLKKEMAIEGVDRLIGGFATMKNANTIDNSSPLGTAIFHNAIDTLKEVDKQYSRTLWEYEGSELAVDIDESFFVHEKGKPQLPKRKKRLYRSFDFNEFKNSGWNIFSPQIRDTALFNGLNEYLRQAESESGFAFGVISKIDNVALTATEIKSSKQDYFVTISDIQDSLQSAFDDLLYGIYVLCKLYGIPVRASYITTHDWDDSILVDKEQARNQALIERNAQLTDDVQYFMETRNMKKEEAIAFVDEIRNRRPKIETEEEEE